MRLTPHGNHHRGLLSGRGAGLMNPVPGRGRKTLYHRVTPSSFTVGREGIANGRLSYFCSFLMLARLKYKHIQRPVKAGSFFYNVKPESPKRLLLKRPHTSHSPTEGRLSVNQTPSSCSGVSPDWNRHSFCSDAALYRGGSQTAKGPWW